jgi:hypothetical protein
MTEAKTMVRKFLYEEEGVAEDMKLVCWILGVGGVILIVMGWWFIS